MFFQITTFKRLLLINCRDEFENRAAVSATYERKTGILTGNDDAIFFLLLQKILKINLFLYRKKIADILIFIGEIWWSKFLLFIKSKISWNNFGVGSYLRVLGTILDIILCPKFIFLVLIVTRSIETRYSIKKGIVSN